MVGKTEIWFVTANVIHATVKAPTHYSPVKLRHPHPAASFLQKNATRNTLIFVAALAHSISASGTFHLQHQTQGCANPSVANTRCTAGRASIVCRYGPRCG